MRASRFLIPALLAVLVLACRDSGTNPPPPRASGGYDALTTREAVLRNLQRACNERNVAEYQKLLDDGFVFFLSDGDVNAGLPSQWDATTELSAITHMFSQIEDPMDRWPLCTAIQMDVVFEDGVTWIDVPVPTAAVAETWYTTTCFYDFQIEVRPDTHYFPSPGAKAQFTVRNAGSETKPSWRLVEMRDLGAMSLSGGHRPATEQSTWGKVKSLFR